MGRALAGIVGFLCTMGTGLVCYGVRFSVQLHCYNSVSVCIARDNGMVLQYLAKCFIVLIVLCLWLSMVSCKCCAVAYGGVLLATILHKIAMCGTVL